MPLSHSSEFSIRPLHLGPMDGHDSPRRDRLVDGLPTTYFYRTEIDYRIAIQAEPHFRREIGSDDPRATTPVRTISVVERHNRKSLEAV